MPSPAGCQRLFLVPSALYAAGISSTRSSTKQRYLSQALFVTAPHAICLVAITVFYVLIYLETRKHKLIAVPGQPLSKEVRNAKIERQVAETTFLLTSLLLISFSPAIVLPFILHKFNQYFSWRRCPVGVYH